MEWVSESAVELEANELDCRSRFRFGATLFVIFFPIKIDFEISHHIRREWIDIVQKSGAQRDARTHETEIYSIVLCFVAYVDSLSKCVTRKCKKKKKNVKLRNTKPLFKREKNYIKRVRREQQSDWFAWTAESETHPTDSQNYCPRFLCLGLLAPLTVLASKFFQK